MRTARLALTLSRQGQLHLAPVVSATSDRERATATAASIRLAGRTESMTPVASHQNLRKRWAGSTDRCNTPGMLLKLVAEHKIPVDKIVTYEFSFVPIFVAYDMFANAATRGALKVLNHQPRYPDGHDGIGA